MIEKLALSEKQQLLVFNKIDRVDRRFTRTMENRYSGISISCHTEEGIEKLVQTLEMMVEAPRGGLERLLSFRDETRG